MNVFCHLCIYNLNLNLAVLCFGISTRSPRIFVLALVLVLVFHEYFKSAYQNRCLANKFWPDRARNLILWRGVEDNISWLYMEFLMLCFRQSWAAEDEMLAENNQLSLRLMKLRIDNVFSLIIFLYIWIIPFMVIRI